MAHNTQLPAALAYHAAIEHRERCLNEMLTASRIYQRSSTVDNEAVFKAAHGAFMDAQRAAHEALVAARLAMKREVPA